PGSDGVRRRSARSYERLTGASPRVIRRKSACRWLPLPFSSPRKGRLLRMPSEFQIPLRGPSGEPVDLVRTFMSHGVADLLPGRVDEAARSYTTTLALPRTQPRTIRISEGRPAFARVEVEGRKLGQRATDDLTAAVRQILNLDED